MGRGIGARARGARLPSAGDDELGLRVHPRPPRRRGDARRGRRARRRDRRRDEPAGLGRPRERLRLRARRRRPRDPSGRPAGAVAASIEDWHETGGPLPGRPSGRADRRRLCGRRRTRLPVHGHRPGGEQIRGNPDLEDTIARLQAYERAGAHVLYAPGLHTAQEITAVCEATSRPVNVLAFTGLNDHRDLRRGRPAGERRRRARLDRDRGDGRRRDGDPRRRRHLGLAPGAQIRAWLEDA